MKLLGQNEIMQIIQTGHAFNMYYYYMLIRLFRLHQTVSLFLIVSSLSRHWSHIACSN